MQKKKFGWTVWGIIGLIFAPIGFIHLTIGLVAGSFQSFQVSGDPVIFTSVFTGMGTLFLVLGLGFIGYDLLRRHRLRQAYDGGNAVEARIRAIREIQNVNMNGRHPAVIECSYIDPYGEEHIYRSRYIYSRLTEDLIGRTVPVYIDRMNDKIGFVDVDSVL